MVRDSDGPLLTDLERLISSTATFVKDLGMIDNCDIRSITAAWAMLKVSRIPGSADTVNGRGS